MNNIQENSCLKNEKKKKETKTKDDEISLIFRNQLSNDTTLKFKKSSLSLLKISDITERLLSQLNKSKTDSYIRLFFKGRPLKESEKMKDLCKKIIK
jgi:hypothetical protein